MSRIAMNAVKSFVTEPISKAVSAEIAARPSTRI